MLKSQDPVSSLRIATPCEAKWEEMAGGERLRHCSLCRLNVYNFGAMTRGEIAELLQTTEGRLCARLYQRADGTLLTSDCPSTSARRSRRKLRWRTATLGALITLSAFLSACTTFTRPRLNQHGSGMELNIERVATLQAASLAGTVLEESGSPLPGVTVVVKDEATQRELRTVTNETGAFEITSIGDGVYRVEVTLFGLQPMIREHVTLTRNDVARAQIRLRLDPTITVTVGALIMETSPVTSDPGTTTFSEEFIRNLPVGR
jgi:hypothetical protein